MHTQIWPLTQGSRRGMARLKPLPPCAMYTLTSTFLILKFPTNSIQKKYIPSSKNPWIPQCQSHLHRSPALHPSRFPRPPGPSCRKDTWRQDQHKIASQSWPWKLRKTTSCKASLCTWLGEGRVKLTTCSWKKGRTLRNYFFWTPPKILRKHDRRFKAVEYSGTIWQLRDG